MAKQQKIKFKEGLSQEMIAFIKRLL